MGALTQFVIVLSTCRVEYASGFNRGNLSVIPALPFVGGLLFELLWFAAN